MIITKVCNSTLCHGCYINRVENKGNFIFEIPALISCEKENSVGRKRDWENSKHETLNFSNP